MDKKQSAALIPIMQAFVDGKQIQYRSAPHHPWKNIDAPSWSATTEYRIEPDMPWYRVALFSYGLYAACHHTTEKAYQEDQAFVRWLTNRIEYEV